MLQREEEKVLQLGSLLDTRLGTTDLITIAEKGGPNGGKTADHGPEDRTHEMTMAALKFGILEKVKTSKERKSKSKEKKSVSEGKNESVRRTTGAFGKQLHLFFLTKKRHRDRHVPQDNTILSPLGDRKLRWMP